MTFEPFYYAVQDALKVFICFPILCAIFRAIFIAVYNPYPTLKGKWGIIGGCFRYGFWWGMDYNAYLFLIPMLVVGLPAVFWPQIETVYGTSIRLVIGCAYALVLYAFFMAKMMFYKHFHDIFNYLIFMGKNADQDNSRDIFFNEEHGLWWILGVLPYSILVGLGIYVFLQLPSLSFYHFENRWIQYVANFFFGLLAIVFFQWLRFGGTLEHRNKPEWDFIPSQIKKDIFFARACVDDLPAYKRAKKEHKEQGRQWDSKEVLLNAVSQLIDGTSGQVWDKQTNPLASFKRVANGSPLTKVPQIFLIVGESIPEWGIDPLFSDLHILDQAKKFLKEKHVVKIQTSLPAGNVSRPSIVALMSGIYDAKLELNEKSEFWREAMLTALPRQLKELGYATHYWYGGSATNGSFDKFGLGQGFDSVHSATDFCGPEAPRTWVGVYDHVFLEALRRQIPQIEGPAFHMVYTTSNHGPYKIPDDVLGYDAGSYLSKLDKKIQEDKAKPAQLGTAYYADKNLQAFIKWVQQTYPEALIIYTGDHSNTYPNIENTSLLPREFSIRERWCTPIAFYHQRLTREIFKETKIATHLSILPTILDLVASKGTNYYSLVPPLTERQLDVLVTPTQWISQEEIGEIETNRVETLISPSIREAIAKKAMETDRYLKKADSYSALDTWLLQYIAGKGR